MAWKEVVAQMEGYRQHSDWEIYIPYHSKTFTYGRVLGMESMGLMLLGSLKLQVVSSTTISGDHLLKLTIKDMEEEVKQVC